MDCILSIVLFTLAVLLMIGVVMVSEKKQGGNMAARLNNSL